MIFRRMSTLVSGLGSLESSCHWYLCPFSIHKYCTSKVWFRTISVDLREAEVTVITSKKEVKKMLNKCSCNNDKYVMTNLPLPSLSFIAKFPSSHKPEISICYTLLSPITEWTYLYIEHHKSSNIYNLYSL